MGFILIKILKVPIIIASLILIKDFQQGTIRREDNIIGEIYLLRKLLR